MIHQTEKYLHKINVRGVIVGNPLINHLLQRQSMDSLARSIGAINSEHVAQVELLEKRCEQAIVANSTKANLDCIKIFQYISYASGNMSVSDVRK